MSSFFRRLRRDKEEPASPSEDPEIVEEVPEDPQNVREARPGEVVDDDRPLAEEASSRVAPLPSTDAGAFPEGVASPPSSASPTAEIGPGPPPPLPAADAEADRPLATRRDGAQRHCFICGTEMDGPWCPACRMVWNE